MEAGDFNKLVCLFGCILGNRTGSTCSDVHCSEVSQCISGWYRCCGCNWKPMKSLLHHLPSQFLVHGCRETKD
ncbi:hypothetical protein GUJ93_ZPchr0011g27873 [Zizania palustris]|uniref:Uncharacterized protein n=1 Tax=Zizania palustris TaxID=103762 RepID=A0A8J5WGT7_ZIZPA|nr:hypothetical protein GUJ93_ZPchr0011g27873 [Zizania palustris]